MQGRVEVGKSRGDLRFAVGDIPVVDPLKRDRDRGDTRAHLRLLSVGTGPVGHRGQLLWVDQVVDVGIMGVGGC